MALKRSKQPEVLPGANVDEDCQVSVETGAPPDAITHDKEEEAHEHDVTWDAVSSSPAGDGSGMESWRVPRHRWSTVLEKVALAVEAPANKILKTPQLNPLYQTGPIATFLLIIVGLTGLYLFLFFQYGFEASYEAVANMEEQLIARLIRAIHRYASGALVITTLLHAYRTLFMERFRGPRWLAWTTGIAMTVLLWGAGVTGYWMIWDERAQLINDGFVDFLGRFTSWAPGLIAYMIEVEGSLRSWPVLLILLAVHVLLFLIVAGFFWLHILRLKRPRWIPDVQWVVGLGLVLLVVSAIFPAGMLPAADPTRLPGPVTLDPIFLFYLPFSGTRAALFLWGGLLIATAGLAALPWLLRPKRETPQPKVNIIKDRCTGCTKCALDCPYGAIEMVERHDEKRHKYIAIEDVNLCVGCGICVGSCDGVAVTLGEMPPELMWDSVAAKLALAQAKAPAAGIKVIFTCERHATHGARPYLNGTMQHEQAIELITLPCVGTAPPDLMKRALDAGAAEVQIVGCPPNDCANREGNFWTSQRITRQRVPRLRRAYADAPVTALWLAPDAFGKAITEKREIPKEERLRSRRINPPFTWQNLSLSFVLLAAVMVVQVLLTDLPFRPYVDPPAVAQAILSDPALAFDRFERETAVAGPVEFRFAVDGELVYQQAMAADELRRPDAAPLVAETELAPGDYRLTLSLETPQTQFVLFDRMTSIDGGHVFRFGYDSGRTGACYGDHCLKMNVTPPKTK